MANNVLQTLVDMNMENEVAHDIIDLMSIAVATSRDQWMCSGCFADSSEHTASNYFICTSDVCYRSYCKECLKERGCICKCGQFIEVDSVSLWFD
uniref:Uncharacterized protein n=1 Tax=Clandestinovirus TaxID=2831644 RepID=A0A8F8PN79_9VIRU|nr:hypothetical protein KOM_12_293 [Clandestinovirus]